jgi:hypothetical protein
MKRIGIFFIIKSKEYILKILRIGINFGKNVYDKKMNYL